MDNRWPDYALSPANAADFVRYVGTMLEDLGYGVSAVAPADRCGVDLIAVEPSTNRCIAVQAPFFGGGVLGNPPVQQLLSAMPRWGAAEGWLITNASGFNEGAWRAAQVSGIRLVGAKELGDLVAQAGSMHALGYPGGAGAGATAQPAASGVVAGYPAVAPGGSQPAAAGTPAAYPASAAVDPMVAGAGAHDAGATALLGYAPQTSLASPYGAPDVTGVLAPVGAAYGQPMAAPMPDAPRILGPTEVMMRWNCTDDYLREQMRYGLPLYQQPDGSYGIAEQELLRWEYMMALAAANQEESGSGCAIGAAISFALFVIAIVAIIVFYSHIAEAIEGAFPGVHVLRWDEIVEKLPWTQ